MSFVLDTSALVAVLLDEPDADAYRRYLNDNIDPVMGVTTLYELYCVARRQEFSEGEERIATLLSLLEPELMPFDIDQLLVARGSYARYGRGSGNPANLNMGDCFAYALAKSRGLPLLFKGDDFIHTDIRPALERT